MTARCEVCGDVLDTDAYGTCVSVTGGYTPKREQGGPNVVYGIQRGKQYVHKACVTDARPAAPPKNQTKLEGVE